MTNESGKPGSQKQLDREIKDMVNVITSRVTDLNKSGSIHHEDEDEHDVRIITLAGSNTGATFRGELDHETNKPAGEVNGGPALGETDGLSTYVNSSFQAVNNSLMMGGSYTMNDPGVRMDINDVVGQHRPEKRWWKGKKKDKERETFHSDQQHDDGDDD